jgi:hypothetical protein
MRYALHSSLRAAVKHQAKEPNAQGWEEEQWDPVGEPARQEDVRDPPVYRSQFLHELRERAAASVQHKTRPSLPVPRREPVESTATSDPTHPPRKL